MVGTGGRRRLLPWGGGLACCLLILNLAPDRVRGQASSPVPQTGDEAKDPVSGSEEDGLLKRIEAFQEAEARIEYRFLKGDQVEVRVLGYPELSKAYAISEDGTLIVGLGDPVIAANRTAQEVRERLESELGRFLQKPKVSIFLAKAGERKVFVIGDLPKAGQVTLAGQSTLLETLTQAGWKYDSFSGHEVNIVRQDRTLLLDVNKVVRDKSNRLNLRLRPDDIVIFASPDPVMVIGEVKQPGRYALGERKSMTLRELIAHAQGITQRADLGTAKIIHNDGRETRVDLNAYLFPRSGSASEEIALSGGDTLYLPQGADVGVFVLGMVNRPGFFRHPKGLTVLQALALADDPQFGAKLSKTKLVQGYTRGEPQVIEVNVDRLIHKGDMTQNLAMDDGDVLFVPETGASDTLDFLNRLLAPLNLGVTGTAAAVAVGTR